MCTWQIGVSPVSRRRQPPPVILREPFKPPPTLKSSASRYLYYMYNLYQYSAFLIHINSPNNTDI